MKRAIAVVIICAAALGAVVSRAGAQPPVELMRLFSHEAGIAADRAGLVRLVLPSEVLATCRSDLSDLRIFDSGGKEVAYLLDSGRGVGVEATESFRAEVVGLKRESSDPEDGPAISREVYEIVAPPRPPETGRWDLVFDALPPRFVREVEVAVPRSGGVEGALVTRAPLFRLDRDTHRMRIPLPPFSADTLSVTIEGKEDFYVEPTFRFESARVFDELKRAVVPLREVSRARRDGKTVVELARPSGLVPDQLRIETATGSFNRRVDVWDVRPGSTDVRIGRGRLYRVEARQPVAHPDVRLRPARGERLRVAIDDGDSPPLEAMTFDAVVRQPVLIFSMPTTAAVGEAAGTLRFGGGRAHRPRYDLTGLLLGSRAALAGDPARAAARLYDPSELGRAWLGDVRPSSIFDATPALAFAMHPGAEIDPRVYAHRRPIAIAPSSEGLSGLRMAPEDVARARADLADVRVVDSDSRQWPYLIERDALEETVTLRIESEEHRDATSTYALALPVAPLRIAGIVLEADAPFFHRPYRLLAGDDGEADRLVSRGRLIKDGRNPKPVRISFAPERVEALELAVEDGDDAPLAFRSVRVVRRLPELFLVAPAGDYVLLVGNPDAAAPRYELERVRDVVLAVSSNPARTGELEPNPSYSVRARLAAGGSPTELLQRVIVWGVLLAAVVVLGLLTLRVARRDS
jgi:hypothetical protein